MLSWGLGPGRIGGSIGGCFLLLISARRSIIAGSVVLTGFARLKQWYRSITLHLAFIFIVRVRAVTDVTLTVLVGHLHARLLLLLLLRPQRRGMTGG